jgi:hypothetical protein
LKYINFPSKSLKALGFTNPPEFVQGIRDTAKYKLFREILFKRGVTKNECNTPSLRNLASCLLGKQIQQDTHDSIEDARIPMELYCKFKNVWEKSLKNDEYKT